MQKINILKSKNRKLIINELQKLSYSFTFCQFFIPLFLSVFGVFSLYSCTSSKSAKQIEAAEELLWSKPDSCITFLDELDYSAMSEHDSLVCALMRVHALFKIEYGLEDDSMLHVLKDYFEAYKDFRYAGEANYIIGRNLIVHRNAPLGTFYLKEAEKNLINLSSCPSRIMGAIYYGLGDAASEDRLFSVALDYFCKALPFFIESNDSLYICCSYRNIAKFDDNSENSIRVAFLDSALSYIPHGPFDQYRWSIDAYKQEYLLELGREKALRNYHQLCDSLNLITYATELFEYYIENQEIDSARYYLSISEQDTVNSFWSKEHFLFNKACYLEAIGRKDSAIAVLKDLHLWQTSEIEAAAHTRAYIVEQRYDAERERADRLIAEAGKRRAYLTALIVSVIAVLIIGILLLILKQERLKLQQRTEQLLHKQQLLKEYLKTRLNISEELKLHRTSGKKITEATYNEILSSVAYVRPGHWEQLVADFDAAYAGLLSKLSARYSALTETDKLYIVVIVLGCTTKEICQIMNVTQQSASNQKQRLKLHLDADCNIDDWLHAEVAAHLKEVRKAMARELSLWYRITHF